ncbi:hypothetical protein [Tsukamurella paurometabola]|uniref:Uncharacterized protein n=1 Tax=Tsukamurella paurometabola TaxID=2061 RepID=A0ABS5NFN1_TSUPA|nr:hypothetical protein [Tsukamurella paurometabola]MBS4103078.1 hypothetical protein [Tsukamurella paurometabola]
MLLAADGNLADSYLWPLVALVTPAVLTLTLFLVGRWSARNKEAREVHRAVTSGVGADARSALSDAEFEWWEYGRSPSRTKPEGRSDTEEERDAGSGGIEGQAIAKIDPELFKQFYVVDASLAQLTLILNQYSKRNYWLGQSLRYRQLLGWHVGIHIAWVMWFVSVTCETTPTTTTDGNPGEPIYEPAGRQGGAWQRAKDALSLVGDYRIEHLDKKDRKDKKERTVQGFVASELQTWVENAEKAMRADVSEIAAVKAMALSEVSEPTAEPESSEKDGESVT